MLKITRNPKITEISCTVCGKIFFPTMIFERGKSYSFRIFGYEIEIQIVKNRFIYDKCPVCSREIEKKEARKRIGKAMIKRGIFVDFDT